MIQIIVISLVSIWLAYGVWNVIVGLTQIFWGLACGIVATILYTLAVLLEVICHVVKSVVGAAKYFTCHSTAAAKSESLRPSTRNKNSAS